jgi:hypothetical protein
VLPEAILLAGQDVGLPVGSSKDDPVGPDVGLLVDAAKAIQFGIDDCW